MTDLPRIIGRYHVERLIAHGGMGSLYLARDPAIDRLIVIKILKEGFDDAAARERFAREARAAGRLHHPNIVTIFDVGEHDDRPFIAMEYVAGETLAQLVGRRAIGPVWEKLAILEDLCAGLHYAHGASIVHRDIKPANIMLDGSGLVKILDFGIARAGGGRLTNAGDIVGTLNYMSPEQLAGGPVDHRTDVYSLGAVAYELITGQMAFPGTIGTGVLFNIVNSSPVPIESLVPGTDPDITAMIARAMAREPEARYADLEMMREDLAAVRTRLLETAPDPAELADPNAETRFESARIASDVRSRPSSSRIRSMQGTGVGPPVPPSSSHVAHPPRRRKAALAVGVGGVMLASVTAAMLVLDRYPVTSPAADTSATAPQQVQSPATSAPERSAPADQPDGSVPAEHDGEMDAARPTAREQTAVGQRQRTSAGGKASAAVPPVPKTKPADDPIESAAAKPVNPPTVTVPSLESLKTVTGPADKAAGTPLPPPTAPQPEPAPPPRDPRAADLSAIRETLRRYTDAYESLNGAAVGTVMPSLSARQRRDLDRDLSGYRRYTVEIRDERIDVEGATATVTCHVVRSFEMRNGVQGSKTVPTIFHLRRSGAGWIIERVESR